MVDWHLMFDVVQKTARAELDWHAGMRAIVGFARQHSGEYDPDYWQSVAPDDLPIAAAAAWTVEGFDQLQPFAGWSLVMLDCGDAPDIFRLSECRFSSELTLDDFTTFAKHDAVCSGYDFPVETLVATLCEHYVVELGHPLLSYRQAGFNFQGSNGYLLWLATATFAACEALHDVDFCQRVLRGRSGIVFMSGFEEIFLYVGTISARGLAD